MNRPSNFTLQGGAVRVENFDRIAPFTSFLPGLSGVRGIPLWAFYCNRGQGIASLGIHDKGKAMIPFHPAVLAYEKTPVEGFRTFVRADGQFVEPFSPLERSAKRSMLIRSNALEIEEVNEAAGLSFHVSYHTLPGRPIGALMRSLRIKNISKAAKRVELLDGLPRVIPFGMSLPQYQDMGNLFKSWAEVRLCEENAPMYLLRSSTEDGSRVSESVGACFFYSLSEGKALPILYDPALVFGEGSSLLRPDPFVEGGLDALLERQQLGVNRLACGFSALRCRLEAGEERVIDSYAGFCETATLLRAELKKLRSPGFAQEKRKEAEALADNLLADVATQSGRPLFDAYVRQNYLDNFLRGGYPRLIGGKVVHLFSRKHGDPERDYNWFAIAGQYYSQGNGNFRDVCQNRRMDVRLHPEIGDCNVWSFYSLVQADGYNPLEIRPATFVIRDRDAALRLLAEYTEDADRLSDILEGAFTPGLLSSAIAARGLTLRGDEERLIEGLLALSEQRVEAGFGEGYWSDHWDYLLDLIEDYLAVYPDKKRELLFERKDYRFFDSGAKLRTRDETTQMSEKGLRRWDSLDVSHAHKNTCWLKDRQGREIKTNLLGKLLTLCANKTALLDPEGLGLSMDGGRPGWNDAMNGLPGLFGSGMPETLELKRLLDFVLSLPDGETELPAELAAFLRALEKALRQQEAFTRWEKANDALEAYRAQLTGGLCGSLENLRLEALRPLLSLYRQRAQEGIDKALKIGGGIMPTYFSYRATGWETLKDESGAPRLSAAGLPLARVTAFEREELPLFLEGPARYLAQLEDEGAAKEAISKVRASDLYDRGLEMYLTSVKLDDMSMEYGRIRAFTPGWLERESVFLHMAYKYLLAMLKSNQPAAFWQAAETGLIPFLNPDIYGRSPLENSSFIASSRNPDPAVRGRGFVSRLSGSTAEMLNIWLTVFLGKEGIRESGDGHLSLTFAPMLPAAMFDEKGEASFRLMSRCEVCYHNDSKKDTWGEGGVRPARLRYLLDGREITESGGTLREARALREGRITRVDVWLE